MANKTLRTLTPATSANLTDLLIVRQGVDTEDKSATLSQLAAAIPASSIAITDAGSLFTTDTVEAALQQVGGLNVRVHWYHSVASGTSGTLAAPTGGTIVLNQWPDAADALASTVGTDGVPNWQTPRTSGGVAVAATLDALGNWTLTGTPSAYPVAVVFCYEVPLAKFDRTKAFDELLNIASVEQGVQPAHGFVNRTDSTISRAGAVVTLSGNYTVYVGGKKIVPSTPQSVTVTADAELSFIYLNALGVLQISTSAWSILDLTNIPVALVYKYGSAYVVWDERHGYLRNLELHDLWHKTVGARWQSGCSIVTSMAPMFEVYSGVVRDEDVVGAIGYETTCNLWYRYVKSVSPYTLGMAVETASSSWYKTSGSVLRWDNEGLVSATTGKYYNLWVYGSVAVDGHKPIQVVLPRVEHGTFASATAEGAPTLSSELPVADWKLLYRVTLKQTAGGVEESTKTDFRTVSTGPASTPVSTLSHANLTERNAEDQHPATAITNTPAGNIAATTVQAALNELDSEKAALVHASRHQNGGADEIATATAAANAIPKAGAGGTLATGWIPDLSATYATAAKGVTNGDSHDHNGGDGAAIVEAAITLADNTTNNVSATKHGFTPKAPNDTTKFLRGDGTWDVTATYQEFTADGTWTKPANCKMVYVEACGGGAGGLSGLWRNNATAGASAGGSSGVMVRKWFPASLLGDTVSVTVGAGGNGGTASATENTRGTGNAGGASKFGSLLTALGGLTVSTGGAGQYSQALYTAGTQSLGGYPLNPKGSRSLIASGSGGAGGLATTSVGGVGGEGGGKPLEYDVDFAAGAGYAYVGGGGTAGTAGTGASGGNGGNGADYCGGGGGGGSYVASGVAAGGNGGTGTLGGGGGGGGGACSGDGNTESRGGNGGKGGDGYVRVWAW